MSDQPNDRGRKQTEEIRRKVEEVAGVIQPTIDALREMGYQPQLIADGEGGVVRMTLDVHVIEHG